MPFYLAKELGLIGGEVCMKFQNDEKAGMENLLVKGMATFVRNVAESSVRTPCTFLLHQPKEPKDFEKRLLAMRKK